MSIQNSICPDSRTKKGVPGCFPTERLMKMSGDTIESLIQERRSTEKESKQLQAQIDRLEAEKLEKDDAEIREALSIQIEALSLEKREKAKKLKDICRIARTISAGD